MKKFIFLLTLLALTPAVFLSCEKVDVDTSKGYVDFFAEDTPQSLIVQLQNSYTVKEFIKSKDSYELTFFKPKSFTSKSGKRYPNGIEHLSLKKEDTYNCTETESYISFSFKYTTYNGNTQYQTAKLYFYNVENPIYQIEFELICSMQDVYIFEDYDGTIEIPFDIYKNTLGEPLTISLSDDSPVSCETIIEPDNKKGKFVFKPTYKYDFEESVTLYVTVGNITHKYRTKFVRKKEPYIAENGNKEITLELDDIARTWWVTIGANWELYTDYRGKDCARWIDGELIVNINEGDDWISMEKIEAKDKDIRIYFKFNHFIGSGTRKGTITVQRTYCKETLKVNILQSGSENPGSIRGALMALYNQCGGSEWKLQENWGSDLDVEEWCGISFRNLKEDQNDETTYYNPGCYGYKAQKGAYGPPEGTALSFNFWTEGYWNVITGKIPDEFWNIKCGFQLFTVSFVENAEINKVPPSMWTPKLRTIHLRNMQNGQPAYLCTDLSNISKAIDAEEITLHGKNFSGQLPDDIGKMKRLKTLEINALDLKTCTPIEIGPCPASIVECESLEYLYLAAITNTIPEEIIYLPNIKCCEYINKELGYFCLIDR